VPPFIAPCGARGSGHAASSEASGGGRGGRWCCEVAEGSGGVRSAGPRGRRGWPGPRSPPARGALNAVTKPIIDCFFWDRPANLGVVEIEGEVTLMPRSYYVLSSMYPGFQVYKMVSDKLSLADGGGWGVPHWPPWREKAATLLPPSPKEAPRRPPPRGPRRWPPGTGGPAAGCPSAAPPAAPVNGPRGGRERGRRRGVRVYLTKDMNLVMNT